MCCTKHTVPVIGPQGDQGQDGQIFFGYSWDVYASDNAGSNFALGDAYNEDIHSYWYHYTVVSTVQPPDPTPSDIAGKWRRIKGKDAKLTDEVMFQLSIPDETFKFWLPYDYRANTLYADNISALPDSTLDIGGANINTASTLYSLRLFGPVGALCVLRITPVE